MSRLLSKGAGDPSPREFKAAIVVVVTVFKLPRIFGIGTSNLFDDAWLFRGDLPVSFFLSVSSFNCALRSFAVWADALRRNFVSAISLSSLRWVVFCSARCACRPCYGSCAPSHCC